ncbi:MAG: TonB-dependent receptor [Saprospiraceae bacterium]|nr:TonB-dependent receptor [Saprospiraceae bacterium]
MLKYILLITFYILLSNNLTLAQHSYKGTITSAQTGEPLIGASIFVEDQVITVTDNNGDFEFELEAQPNIFTVQYVGFEVLEMEAAAMTGLIKLEESNTSINQIVVSASRNQQERSDAPIAINSLSNQTLKDAKATRLDEVLNKVSGVYMVDLGNEQHTMAIRQPINYKGLFLYLEDGLPIRPTGVFNHNALLEMNMAALSRIEIIKGPNSALFGSEAIGGAINFITLRPSASPTAHISLRGNNLGYWRGDFNASSTFGKLGIGASGYYAFRKNGFREHSDFNKLALTFRADYNFDDQNTLTLDASYIDYSADMTGSMDSSFFYGQDYTSQQTFTNREVDALRTKLVYNHYWENKGKTTVAGFFRRNSIRQNPSYRIRDDYSAWANPNGDPNLAHSETNDNSVMSLGLIAQHQHKVDILEGMKVNVGASLDYSPNTYVSNYIRVTKSDEGIYTAFETTDSVLTNYEVKLLNLAAYANIDLKITKNLQFSAALRFDQLNYDFMNNLDENAFSAAADNLDNFSAFAPKIGLTYDFGKGNGLFANFSQGFLPPQISELYRGVEIPSLQPAKFNNYELGGWFKPFSKLSFDFSLYLMDGTNEIISVQLPDGTRENQNAGKTRHFGIEYGINWAITKDLFFRINGTNARHLFLDYIENGADYSGNVMGQAPTWICNSELTYKPLFLKGFRISVEWQHINKYFMDNGNTKTYKGYHLFNARLGYEFKGFEIWLNGMNLTNRLYATVARATAWGQRYSVGEPLAIQFGLGYTFRK